MPNPILEKASETKSYGEGVLTHAHVYSHLLILGVIAAVTAIFSISVFSNGGTQAVMPYFCTGLIGGFVLAMFTIFVRSAAIVTAPLYAALEGLALGAISAITEAHAPGAAAIAVVGTFVCFGVSYFLYATKIIKATPGFAKFIIIAMTSILFFYLVSIVMSVFGMPLVALHTGWLGLLISGAIIIVATISFILDFDLIDKSVGQAPSSDAMYLAFGLMVGLVWLYVEILRFAGILMHKD